MFPLSFWRKVHRKTFFAKCREWVHRYGLAEFLSFFIGVSLTALSFFAFGSIVGSAFFGSIVQTVVFYGVIMYRDVRHHSRGTRKRFSMSHALKMVRNLIVEFGPAEYLDTFLIRPFWFSLLPSLVPNYPFALFLGTIAADISYYLPVICAYELRKKYLSD